MPLELHPMLPEDALASIRIRRAAYEGPVHNLIHTRPVSEASIHGVAGNRKRDIANATNAWYWKIVDTSLPPHADDPATNGGCTIATAIWSMHNVPGTQDRTTTADADADAAFKFVPPELILEASRSLLEPIKAAQVEIMGKENPYFSLDSLCAHPEHQGRGAGKMLMEWGLRKADEEGLPVYLDATSAGRRLYDKRGFEAVRDVVWDSEPWGGKEKYVHVCMVRGRGRGWRGGNDGEM